MNPATLKLPTLRSFSTLTISGPDARTFLQGQLSADLRKLTQEHALLASCNSAQGRVQAVLSLIARGEQIIAVLPASMSKRTFTRLRNYLLRAKAQIADAADWALAPLSATQAAALLPSLPAIAGEVVHHEELSIMRWWSADERYLLIAPQALIDAEVNAELSLWWRQADIAAGLPQVYPETHESFVAQMLNLDVLGGISFDKGCYTGQEIIARTHYRGTIKRRLLRFSASCAAPAPGTRVLNGTVPAGEVVDAITIAPGCEMLAVISLEQQHATLSLDGVADSQLTSCSLPYALSSGDADGNKASTKQLGAA